MAENYELGTWYYAPPFSGSVARIRNFYRVGCCRYSGFVSELMVWSSDDSLLLHEEFKDFDSAYYRLKSMFKEELKEV